MTKVQTAMANLFAGMAFPPPDFVFSRTFVSPPDLIVEPASFAAGPPSVRVTPRHCRQWK
jgi:hypothetical protein